ncbi:MAG: sel1 repeat family protein [Treponema sp.]|nr:sel1 repeat family protein [Treponema sp.]
MNKEEMQENFNKALTLYKAGQYDAALPIFETLAEYDHAGAIYYLTKGRYKKWISKIKHSIIIENLQKAADKGITDAEYDMGGCLMLGEVIEADYDKAFKYFQKAAGKGHTEAQVDLAFCYEKGSGVPQDYTKAAHWYEKAAAQGDSYAQEMLNELKSKGKI